LASSLWAPTLHYGIISKGNYTIRARNVAAAIGIRVVLQVVSTARISVARHACDDVELVRHAYLSGMPAMEAHEFVGKLA
jgi:hypothetical protein